MTKTVLTIILIASISPIIKGQSLSDTLFKIAYRPSFHNPCQLAIYKDKDDYKGLFQTVSAIDDKIKIDTTIEILTLETYNSYLNFFSTYKFPGYIDNKIPDTTKNYAQGIDGIILTGTYFGSTNKLFRFWSPYRDKESMTLFKMTLNDLDKYFKTKENKKYLKKLRMYSK